MCMYVQVPMLIWVHACGGQRLMSDWGFLFVCLLAFQDRFLYVALAVLEFLVQTRLSLNLGIPLSQPHEC